ncbi:TraX family protein [[Clostridium] colinum]|uniref:TraX family protein n=1 Tax=[Clostridium] colinum TaxID=36835 RepID=UPI0038CD54E5
MIIDHIGGVIFKNHLLFRYIGRLSFPLYSFLITEGLKKTSNIKNYLKTLFILSIISEIFYDLCFNSEINFINQTNTVYTLFIASISLFFYNKNTNYLIKYFFLFLGILLAYILKTDYGTWGIVLIYIFYFVEDKKYILFYSIFWVTIKNIDFILNILYYKINDKNYIYQSFNLYIFTIIPLFIILFYNGKKGKNIKYIFYILYPFHLFLLYLIKIFLL